MTESFTRLKTALADRYELDREIGAGGMATVYLAEDLKHHRQVAIKVLRPELAAELGTDRFLTEIGVAASLHHPHILPLYDSGEADDFLYYVMPYEEGESLRARLEREGELPVAQAVRILRDVVDALSHAHKQSVVHRDIKPDNILLSERHALVTDFGVAKALSEATGRARITTAGMALGTPAYMAPEQAAADPHVDHRADIYAIGALAYELLAGRPPFVGTTPQQVLAAHVTDEAEPVTKHRESIPQALADVVMRCLEKRPADRWQSAEELIPRLEALATPSGGMTPTGTVPAAAVDYEAAARRAHPIRVAFLFGVGATALHGIVYALIIGLGLPNWVLFAAAALVVLALPITLLTGYHERQRALSRTSAVVAAPPNSGLYRWLRWRKTMIAGMSSFGALAVVVVVLVVLGRVGVGPLATLLTAGVLDRGGTVILADFTDQSGDSALATMFTEAFRSDLNQSPAITVMPSSRIRDVLSRMELDPSTPISLAVAQDLATREGLKAVIAGDIHRASGVYQFVVEVLSGDSGDVLVADRATANDSTEILEAIGNLSRSLRAKIGESLRSVRASPPLIQATTTSLPALRLYSQAVRAIDRGEIFGGYQLLLEATSLDTTFAEAYRALAIELSNARVLRSVQVDAHSRAFRHRHKLPDETRYKVEGSYYTEVEHDPWRAIEAYNSAVRVNPRSTASLNNIGALHSEMRNHEEALGFYRTAIEEDSTEYVYHYNVVTTLIQLGFLDSAQVALERFETIRPNHPSPLMVRAIVAGARMDLDGVTRAFEEMRRSYDFRWQMFAAWGLGLEESIRGNLGAAERYFSTVAAATASARMPRQAWNQYLQMAEMKLVLQGNPQAAMGVVETLLAQMPLESLDPLDRPYLPLAAFYAKAGFPERAQQMLAEYDSFVPPGIRDGDETRERERALGLVALNSGEFPEAIDHMRAADIGTCMMCPVPDLAAVFDAAGYADSAISIYERYVSTPDAHRYLVDWISYAPALKRLGELYEERGDSEQAIERYNEFVEIWQNADPVLQPQVQEVRRRLARLVGEPRGN